jgi:hypothetical protein
MEELTRPRARYTIRVELLEAGNEPVPVEERGKVDAHVRRKIGYAHYRQMGIAVFDGVVGDAAMADLGGGFTVGFLAKAMPPPPEAPWGVRDPGPRVQLQELTLLRNRLESGRAKQVELLRTSAVLANKQRAIFGVGGSEGSARALVLIVTAERVGEG